jgi:CDP-diacylglycerol--glycerol-3-phosphate 3-phosphatidyltransferase
MTAVSPLPNILTWFRIVAGLATFGLLAGAAGSFLPVQDVEGDTQFLYEKIAVAVFVIGAITDFFDGMLARKLHAETAWGATLDPIADKILVCGTILGLFALGQDNKQLALPAALILFREFTVSALRESTAARGIKLPVTLLAKWKTTVQLVALLAELILLCGPAFGMDINLASMEPVAHGLLWLAAAITLWTGWDYVRAARKALPHEQ